MVLVKLLTYLLINKLILDQMKCLHNNGINSLHSYPYLPTSYLSSYLMSTRNETFSMHPRTVLYLIKLFKKHVNKARLKDGKNNLFYPFICMVRKMQQGTSTA